MNAETAIRLNQLRFAAKPVSFEILENRIELRGPYTEALCRHIEAAVDSMGAEAQRLEIIEAAAERREANYREGSMIGSNWAGDYANLMGCRVGHRAAKLAEPAIAAAVAAHNEATARAYETYRVACEQGVAVPPQDD